MCVTGKVRGFTIVELLVVVAIIAILAVAMIGSFRDYAAQKQFDTTTSAVVDLIYTARQQSVASVEGQSYGVYVGTSTIELFTGTSVTPGAADNTIVALPGAMSATSSLSSGLANVSFSHLKGMSSATGTITLSDTDGRTATVTIAYGGVISW